METRLTTSPLRARVAPASLPGGASFLDAMLTTTDAAKRLKCSRRTVQRWCERESIGQRIGRDVLLTLADVARLRKLVQDGVGRPAKT